MPVNGKGGRPEQRTREQAGFTLVELAIVIIISALLSFLLFSALDYKAEEDDRQQTQTALANVEVAMTTFVGINHRYPCPADPTLGPSDPQYGFSATDGTNCTLTPITATQGNTGATDSVFIGAVPFRTIDQSLGGSNLAGADTIDGWGRKLGYAVTGSLASATPGLFDDNHGAIDVIDENNISVLQTPSTAHLVLLSYGEDGRGAYTRDGKLVEACGNFGTPPNPPPPMTQATELDNCDNSNAQFMSGLRNTSQFSYNDDIVEFLSVQNNSLWTITNCEPGHCPTDIPAPSVIVYSAVNTNPGWVGVGVQTPAAPLDISGSLIAAQSGNIQTQAVCANDGSNCMPPATLGGALPQMDCSTPGPNSGPGYVMTGVANNAAVCAKAFTLTTTYSCPTGQYITAISNTGEVHCLQP